MTQEQSSNISMFKYTMDILLFKARKQPAGCPPFSSFTFIFVRIQGRRRTAMTSHCYVADASVAIRPMLRLPGEGTIAVEMQQKWGFAEPNRPGPVGENILFFCFFPSMRS